MCHCYSKRLHRAVNATTTDLSPPNCTWSGINVWKRPFKCSPPHSCTRRRIKIAAERKAQVWLAVQSETILASENSSKTRHRPRRSTQLRLQPVDKVGKHVVESCSPTGPLEYSGPKENTLTLSLECKSAGYTGHVHAPQKTIVKITGQLIVGNLLCGSSAGAADNRPKNKGAAKQPERYNKNAALLLLMRYLFNVQYRRRVRKSHTGGLGKERKAKNQSRTSTRRGRRLKAEVLGYLSSLSAESKELIREVNGDDLLRLKRRSPKGSVRDGVGPVEGSMVHGCSTPEASRPEQAPGHGRTSGRKRTPKACDCCGPNHKPQPAKVPAPDRPGRRGRKKRASGTERETTDGATPVASDGDGTVPLNGASGSEDEAAEQSADMEVEPPASCPSYCTNPLLDHRYCKTEDGDSSTGGESSEREEEGGPKNPLLTTDITDDDITELIHEFLEHFYEKYGSFIPLSESDVLEHLNQKLNTDLASRKTFVNSEVGKYRSGLACAPMHYFKVAYNKHTLTLEDLSTLDDQNWVNDQVINMYGELIMEAVNHKVHFFNSFFHRQLVAKGYEGVKRWTKKVDLFTKSLLLIPIHLEIHWSLITVDITNQTIHFYDSQGIMFKYAVENIIRYMQAEAKEKQNVVYQKGWKMIVNKCVPQQKNDSDCGVFVLEYCKCLALKEPLQFSQEDMPKVRKRIYKELCECKLKR
ncbi:hypothetical protein MATL_G00030950 [Megalops atlanticus]|uniref:Ubiquitin-like protease family profile domain-containing protein n=1 Tax=Megalops atlanticus TaxID=7932 RepID=A0A9D3TCX8_MEGAT|nr:hypothetical protein MATL_G00030950 [Megalops atlanticus]